MALEHDIPNHLIQLRIFQKQYIKPKISFS